MKKNEYLLTVVIPAYNAEDTIERAIKSVIEPCKTGIELIIVNDGSTDATKNKCKCLVKKIGEDRVVLVDQENSGHGSAINIGIQRARGKYLKILDADDYYDADGLRQLVRIIRDNDSDLIINNYNTCSINSDERSLVKWSNELEEEKEYDYKDVITKTKATLLPFATVKTELLRKNNCIVDIKCYYDDREYDYFIMLFAKTVFYSSSSVYVYMVNNDEQSISKKGLIKHIKDHAKVVRWLVLRYYADEMDDVKRKYIFNEVLVPLCYLQYHISIYYKRSRKDFIQFDRFLKDYPGLYDHNGVVGVRIKLHRLTKGVFI